MDLFGFDEEATVDTIEDVSKNDVPTAEPEAPIPVKQSTEQMSISQIKELLLNDLNTSESQIDLSIGNETSFYVELKETTPETKQKRTRPVRTKKLVLAAQSPNYNDDTETSIVHPKRAVKKKGKKKNVEVSLIDDINFLDELENTQPEQQQESKIVRAYTRPVRNRKPVLRDIQNYSIDDTAEISVVKRKREVKKKGKSKNEKENDENIENRAAQINDQFREVDDFQLIVE